MSHLNTMLRTAASAILTGCLGLTSLPLLAQNQEFARLVLIGDANGALVGHYGYCGEMESIDREAFQRVKVPAPNRIWLRRVAGGRVSGTCSLDISIQVEPNQAYIVRYTDLQGACQVETFKVRPQLDPVRHPLNREYSRSCLLQ